MYLPCESKEAENAQRITLEMANSIAHGIFHETRLANKSVAIKPFYQLELLDSVSQLGIFF